MKTLKIITKRVTLGVIFIFLLNACATRDSRKAVDQVKLEEVLTSLMDQALIPGLSIALVRNGDLAWEGAFGVKSMETKEPVKATTVFEAASLSKPVFAYAVMKMVERGELELDKALIDYLGEPCLENGDLELAKKHYLKSLDLNPDNEKGLNMLERIKQMGS